VVLLVRDALFPAARFADEAVPKVLPQRPVFFEVDDGSRFAALVVGDELDSRHALVPL